MLGLVWYELAGFVAIMMTAIYVTFIVPCVCGYDFRMWVEFVNKNSSSVQSKFEVCIGIAMTVILWPFKLVWIICDIIPNMVTEYETQFEKE